MCSAATWDREKVKARLKQTFIAKDISVKNSSNGLNFTKKRAKNWHFFSQKMGIKRAKLLNYNKKTGTFKTSSLKYF